ncbi:facilitated trehalose transporter Tret1 [Tribolium castaneum]|uniref:Facilitated trehalose transporter Tret1-2 homolog-like Protein n=1 Tax=Tribolium castaneum TaxID=7070 RepID=D6X016_TRICA|nr:PREDICTED: facilitated trehalose transporter Tret1 [Tribolium castaneum]EFA10509.1 Facilitated trehalose transporter Tret1-2 homolog-like Protein [Tribolium castaneum]|eukprot:XP_975260.1 PREDICTED: facilitated trehalose transporter Tret1 [Tribolium castaneum]
MCSDTKSDHSTDDDSEPGKTSQYQPLQEKRPQSWKKCTWKGVVAQSFVTGAVMLSSASCGMPVGYSAVLLPQLKYPNESLRIDDEIGSWIASVHSAATPFGSLLSGVLMDRCGRKLALQIASLPLILGWILIGLAPNHAVLLAGRVVAGLSAGLTAAAGQVLIGEISEPHLRGMFSSVPFASYSFGILLVYALGSVLPWRVVAGLSTVLPVLAITIFFFLPESPVWLVRNDKPDEARKALVWLRGGNSLQARLETEHLTERIEKEQKIGKTATSTGNVIFRPEVIKPFIIINLFNVMQIFSGTYIIVFYAVDILSHINNQNLDHFMAAVLTAGVRFIFSIVASALLALIGRRALALTSGLGTTISALCLGTFLYPRDNCAVSDSGGYFAALCVLLYVATNTVGFMILPGVMLGELFPAKVRGLAGGLTFMVFNFVLFATAKAFPVVKNVVGVHGVFWIFGGSGLFASIFLYLMLPETKGKTLSQIEDYFQEGNVTWVARRKGEGDKTEHV